jgi:hypothetical protein
MKNLNFKLQCYASGPGAGSLDAMIITRPACRGGELANLLSAPVDCVF